VEPREDEPTGVKIYFGFTVAGDRSAVTVARKIVDILVEMRHEVYAHLVEDNAWMADRRITPQQVYSGHEVLEQCDFVYGRGVRFLIWLGCSKRDYLLGATTKKNSAVLSRRTSKAEISLLITGISTRIVSGTIFERDEVEMWIRKNLSQSGCVQ